MPQQKLIAFVGLRRSGKDTAAQVLVDRGWKLLKFADALKTMLRAYFKFTGLSDAHINRAIEGDLKEEPLFILQGKTPRWAMQSLGTEWGRDLIGSDLWVDATMAAARLYPQVVVSDCRFPNEAAAIRAAGGDIVRIVRDGLVIDSHPSESILADIPEDYTILNTGTIDDLKQKVLKLIPPL